MNETTTLEEIVNISSLENINAQQHADIKIKFVGTPMRIKKETRITAINWKCEYCGNTYKMECEDYVPKLPGFCECRHRKYSALHQYFETGFKLTMVNNISDITSGETINVFVPFKLLGIQNQTGERSEIVSFMKNAGNQIEIIGRISSNTPMPKTENAKKAVVEYEIIAEKIKTIHALENYSFAKIQTELQGFTKEKTWSRTEIDKIILPEITGRNLAKQLILLTALTPKQNQVEKYCPGRGIIIGDPGEAKSELGTQFVNQYCKNLNAITINAETSTRAGLMAAVVKDQQEWFIDWGVLTWAHNGFVFQDGWHSFTKEDMAACREVESKNRVDILKVVKGFKECAFRAVKIANPRLAPLNDYYRNKYRASFDIGTGEQDQANKFTGADRRRSDWIIVFSKDDVAASDVDAAITRKIAGGKDSKPVEEISQLIQTAWALTPDKINTENNPELMNWIDFHLSKWRKKYEGIDLAILQKEGKWILLKYTLASAILFFRFDKKGNLQPCKADVDYTAEVFEEMIKDLEIEKEIKNSTRKNLIAKKILEALTNEQLELLKGLAESGNVSSLAVKKGITRKTFYNKFQDALMLEMSVGNSEIKINYNCFEGYIDEGGLFSIEPLIKSGLTELGLAVIKKSREVKENE